MNETEFTGQEKRPLATVIWLGTEEHLPSTNDKSDSPRIGPPLQTRTSRYLQSHIFRNRSWLIWIGSGLCLGLFLFGLCIGGWQSKSPQGQGLVSNQHLSSVHANQQNVPTTVSNPNSTPNTDAQTVLSNQIQIDIHGDVKHPGVYSLPATDRVQDVVQAAGGFNHSQDRQLLNEAQPLSDGEEVDVPRPTVSQVATSSSENDTLESPIGNDSPGPTNSGTDRTGSVGTIDLNTADASTLETIPGIGPRRAAEIIAYRQVKGPFLQIGDLHHIHGFGTATIARISAYVIV